MNPSLSTDIPTWVPASAALWLLASTWQGWRRGLIRQTASLLGLGLGVAAGFWLGPLLAPIVPSFGLPHFLSPLVGGALAGILIWGGVSVVSAIVFRKTEDQGFGLIRLFYGFSGAALGFVSGLLVLGLAVWGVRFFGSFAEGLQKGTASALKARGRTTVSPEPAPLVDLKKLIESSAAGEWLSHLDPLPENLYLRIRKIGQVLTDSAARDRLMNDPGMEALSKNQKLLTLRTDPDLLEALRSVDVWAVLRHPKVQVAASDAELRTAFRTIDIDKLLDRALAPANPGSGTPTGPPEKTPSQRTGGGRAKP